MAHGEIPNEVIDNDRIVSLQYAGPLPGNLNHVRSLVLLSTEILCDQSSRHIEAALPIFHSLKGRCLQCENRSGFAL